MVWLFIAQAGGSRASDLTSSVWLVVLAAVLGVFATRITLLSIRYGQARPILTALLVLWIVATLLNIWWGIRGAPLNMLIAVIVGAGLAMVLFNRQNADRTLILGQILGAISLLGAVLIAGRGLLGIG